MLKSVKNNNTPFDKNPLYNILCFFKASTVKLGALLLITLSLSLQSCSEDPDKFFGVAILNTNMMSDFGTPTLAKHINDDTIEFPDIPSSKKKGDEAVKHLQSTILYLEKSLKDIKNLGGNSDVRKEIKEQSIALYEFALPVYKNEYTAYAKLCDAKAPQDQKDKILKSIEEKYNAEFEKKYAALLANGKTFAEQNNLKVDWN